MKETNVPTGWSVKTLGDLGQVKVGLTYKPENVSEFGTLVLRSSNIQNDRLAFHDNVFVDIPVGEGATVHSGDLLICVRNGSRRLIGKTAMIDQNAHGMAFGAFMSAFRSDLNRYLIWLFQSQIIQEQIEENLGATINQITNATLKSFQIPLPDDPNEQEAIAEALSDADALIEGLERLIAKKRLIKQGAMQDLLTAKRRLPGFSGEWEHRDIDGVALILDNLRVPLNDAQRQAIPGSIPYCGANGVVDFVGKHLIDDDVILMAEDGGYFDQFQTRPIAYRMIGKIWVNNHAHVLKARAGFDHGFLFHSLRHKDITPFLASGTRAKLNKGELKKITVFAPQEEREQAAIAALLDDMDAEIQALDTRLEKARQVKEGMMQNLLTGRIRLV